MKAYYREGDIAAQQLVFQISMLWGSIKDDILIFIGQSRYEELKGMFERGTLDKDLGQQVKLRNEHFEIKHLSFLQTTTDIAPELVPESSGELQFKVLKVKLREEVSAWQAHCAAVHEWECQTHEARHDKHTLLHKLRLDAVNQHCDASFPVVACGVGQESKEARPAHNRTKLTSCCA